MGLLVCLGSPSLRAQGESPLRQGEQIKIMLAGVPAVDQQSMAAFVYTISDAAGTIRVQYLDGEVRAAGLTATALARNLENAYKKAEIYTNPVINVSRADGGISTQSETVTVSGNVKQSGSVALRPGMRITDAIAERGGPDDFATMRRVKLQRGSKSTEHNVSNISDLTQNVLLRAGDTIHVPKANVIGR